MVDPIETIIVPAAGLGERLQPITRIIPKELLPVHLKPAIGYALDEAWESGCRRVIVVVRPGKELVRRYCAEVWSPSTPGPGGRPPLKIDFTEQEQPSGLAHAIFVALQLAGSGPLGLLLPDNLVDAQTPALSQLRQAFQRMERPASLVALTEVAAQDMDAYGKCGWVRVEPDGQGLLRIRHVAPKGLLPPPLPLPDLPIIRSFGRQILAPDFFHACLATRPGPGQGEWDDVPALQTLARDGRLAGVLVRGRVFDVGNPVGYFRANQYYFERHLRNPA